MWDTLHTARAKPGITRSAGRCEGIVAPERTAGKGCTTKGRIFTESFLIRRLIRIGGVAHDVKSHRPPPDRRPEPVPLELGGRAERDPPELFGDDVEPRDAVGADRTAGSHDG